MKLKHLITAAAGIMILSACGSGRHIPYMKDADNISQYDLEKTAKIYEAKIMPKDVLTISVNTTIPEAAAPFNLGSTAGSGITSATGGAIQGAELQTYVVDNQGFIEYPVIGRLKVLGLTRVQLQDLIKTRYTPATLPRYP